MNTLIWEPGTKRTVKWWENDPNKALVNRNLIRTEMIPGIQPDLQQALQSIEELRNTAGKNGQMIIVLGYDSPGDGGGGIFEYCSNQSDLNIDQGTVFNSSDEGKWVRIYEGSLKAAWFGVKPVEEKLCLIEVNGKSIGYIGFPANNSMAFNQKENIRIPLDAGKNEIRIVARYAKGDLILKNLSIGGLDMEARNFSSNSGTVFQEDNLVLSNHGSWIEWDSINVPLSGTYMLNFTYSNPDVADLDMVKLNTQRFQRALDAAAGKSLLIGKGVFQISDTLIIPGNTRVEGLIPPFQDPFQRGTVITTCGEGSFRKWQDTGDEAKDRFRPVLVFGGNNIYLTQIGIISGDQVWEVGVLLPTVKGCVLDNCEILGFGLAGCFMDATWSKMNKRMIQLHDRKIQPADGLQKNTIWCCKLQGQWGLMVRGAENRNPADYSNEDWIMAPEGSSDLSISGCRIQSRGADGGAYYHDVPVKNSEDAGEGHRFISCRLHMNSKYMIKIKHTKNISITGCYLEGWGHDNRSMMINDEKHTGKVEFFALKFVDADWEQWYWGKTEQWP